MILLGFDTATPATAVGLLLADGSALQSRDDPAPGERPAHATRLLVLARELLEQVGLDWQDVQRLAVGLGPGSFTGLRIGVATTRALAQSLGVEAVGVSTLRTLAEGAHAREDGTPGAGAAPVLAVIDARRGEAFAAAYARRLEVIAPSTVAPEGLCALAAQAQSTLAVGDGAVRFRANLQAVGVTVPPGSSPLHRVNATVLCRLAADAPTQPLETVVPHYLRRPDAEIGLQRAGR